MHLMLAFIMLFVLSGFSHTAELTIDLIPEQNVFKQKERHKPLGGAARKSVIDIKSCKYTNK